MKKQNWIQKEFLLCVIFILITLLIECAKEKPVPRREYFRYWAGSPNNPQQKPFDHFYMNQTARASNKSIEKKSKAMMESTCTERATYFSKNELASSVVGNTFCGQCGCYKCPSSYPDSSLNIFPNAYWVSCSGDHEIDPAIEALIEKMKETVKVEYTECKPIAIPDPNIEGSECTVYTHIPGGRKSIWEQCVELEKKFESKR